MIYAARDAVHPKQGRRRRTAILLRRDSTGRAQTTSAEVIDIIKKPPAHDRYETIKRALISRLSVSQEKKTKQLLHKEHVGDRRPSRFLGRLRNLAGNDVSDNLLRTLRTDRLPRELQPILATQCADTPPDRLAELADRVRIVRAANKTPAFYPEYIEAAKMELRKEMREELRHAHGIRRHDKETSRRCNTSNRYIYIFYGILGNLREKNYKNQAAKMTARSLSRYKNDDTRLSQKQGMIRNRNQRAFKERKKSLKVTENHKEKIF
ncbi:UNVERIFIED_CONTAM: hypothetical protein PYX00_005215 [Menopon gallinae]|uniref:DUF7041 domain-containing protein n=1 Tax=Menopon gallinae TaxID=328185 RepID=A0AAW2HRM8_9NEOP